MPGHMAAKKIKIRLNKLTGQQITSNSFAGFIRSLMRILDQSPTGRTLLQTAAAQNTSVGLDPLLEPSSSFFYPSQNHFDFGYQPDILQKTEKGQGRYLVSFIGGLCRACRHLHRDNSSTSFAPDEFLPRLRCEEADISSTIHLIGWELRAAGHAFLWRYLLSGPSGDMTIVFESVVTEDPQTQFDGRAQRAAFHQWFAGHERIESCDSLGREMIDLYALQREQSINQLLEK